MQHIIISFSIPIYSSIPINSNHLQKEANNECTVSSELSSKSVKITYEIDQIPLLFSYASAFLNSKIYTALYLSKHIVIYNLGELIDFPKY